MATGGLVTSIIGTVLGVVLYLACAACVKGAQQGVKELQKKGYDMNKIQRDMKKAIEEAKKRQQKK